MLSLIEGARMGDSDAFDRLAGRLRATIRRWATRFTGDADEAEDVTQDVLLRLHERLEDFRGRSALTTWLYRMTRNVAASGQRTRARRSALLAGHAPSLPAAEASRDADRDAAAARLAAIVRECFERLPPRQREVFRLCDLEGRSTTDVAAILGIGASSVRVTLFNARRAIRARMLDEQRALLEDYES
jgi:RNA polymerase sigma-70 factor (ECF subfamily)